MRRSYFHETLLQEFCEHGCRSGIKLKELKANPVFATAENAILDPGLAVHRCHYSVDEQADADPHLQCDLQRNVEQDADTACTEVERATHDAVTTLKFYQYLDLDQFALGLPLFFHNIPNALLS